VDVTLQQQEEQSKLVVQVIADHGDTPKRLVSAPRSFSIRLGEPDRKRGLQEERRPKASR
ncbi:MAG TPA: hypothetical protein PKI21_02410, partial [Nitrospira sp.]|nr:hypothetical protein [Nitrospira sp.]